MKHAVAVMLCAVGEWEGGGGCEGRWLQPKTSFARPPPFSSAGSHTTASAHTQPPPPPTNFTGLAAAQRGPPPMPSLPGDGEPAMQAAVSEKTDCGYCSFWSSAWEVRG